jgi:hypothetical protein
VENGAYREMLLAAAYGLSLPWQQVGLAEVIYGEADAASLDAALRAYYADAEHRYTASCSPLFLSPLLSDKETVRAARQTARSLTAYLLEEVGFSGFCAAGHPAAILPDWQKQLGLTVTLDLPEGNEFADEIELSHRDGYLCVLNVRNFSVMLSEKSWLLEPVGLYTWFCSFSSGMDLVLDRIRTEAPSSLETAMQHFAEPIEIYFIDSYSMTYTYPVSNQINLSKADAVWHEMVHLLLEEPIRYPGLGWENEAIAEHFSYPATTFYAPTTYVSEGYDAYLDFFADVGVSGKEAEADDLVFHQSVWNLYQTFRDPELTDRDDLEAYCRAYGICSLVLDGQIERTQRRNLYDMSVAAKRSAGSGSKDTDGNALTYPESLVVFEYLAEVCGMDAAVDAHISEISLEEAFGVSYPELFAAAKEYYISLYADQMALN